MGTDLTAIALASLAELLARPSFQTGGLSHVETLAPAGRYSRRPPFRIESADLEEAQRPLVDAYFGKTIQDYGPLEHVVLRDALVVGQGSVITAGFDLIRESAAEFINPGLTPDGLSAGPGGLQLNKAVSVQINTPTLLLKRPWWANYGHWLVDSAALAVLAAKMTMPANWQVVIAAQGHDGMRKAVHESLDLLLPGIPVVTQPDDQLWTFAELHYVSPVHIPPLMKLPEAMAGLRAMVLRGRLGDGAARRGIYVTRGTHGTRQLVNEMEVTALCQEMGLEVIAPETLSLAEQASQFHRAGLIVGVKGAGLANVLFCPARTHVVALSPGDFPDPFFWDLAAQSGIAYSELFGPLISRGGPQGSNPFTVDVSLLRSMLTACRAALA